MNAKWRYWASSMQSGQCRCQWPRDLLIRPGNGKIKTPIDSREVSLRVRACAINMGVIGVASVNASAACSCPRHRVLLQYGQWYRRKTMLALCWHWHRSPCGSSQRQSTPVLLCRALASVTTEQHWRPCCTGVLVPAPYSAVTPHPTFSGCPQRSQSHFRDRRAGTG